MKIFSFQVAGMLRGSDKAYEILRQRLVSGHYKPGAQLKEEPIARELDLSRTPVRTALRRLVEEGLAVADSGQGVHVAEWTERDIEETFQLRMLLEPYAACLAAQRGGVDLLRQLEACHQRMAAAIAAGGKHSISEIQGANRDFHHALLVASGSPRLQTMLQTIIDMPIIVRSFTVYTPADLARSLHQHGDLLAAVEARDGELARQAMGLHLRTSYLRFMARRSELQLAAQTSASKST